MVEFPHGHIAASGFEQLLSLASQGTIRILDVEFVAKDAAGAARRVEASELGNPDGIDLSASAGASSACSIRPMSP